MRDQRASSRCRGSNSRATCSAGMRAAMSPTKFFANQTLICSASDSAQRQLGLDALDFVVAGELGALRRGLHRLVEQAELIDEAVALGIGADPHAALRDGMHFVAGLLAAFGHVREEFLVAALDERLQQHLGVFAERAIDAQLAGEVGGAHAVDVHADLLERVLEGRDGAEDADGAGDRGRMRPDLVGRAAM